MKSSAWIVTLVPLPAIAFFAYRLRPAIWTSDRIAGLTMLIVGLAVVTLARFQLADSFSITPRATKLVTHGIYSRIRNPVYVFSAIALFGFVLYLDLPYFFWAFLILIPVQILRARAESRVLEQHFGDEYRRYKSTTWF
ncbi:MAG TPA: methyltransferase [Candidatus Acidoferrales bacterium]|nr:methyltransferase [Candidatus Acidoferrales bacterium]